MVYLRCTSRVHPEYVLFDTRGFGPRDPSQSSEILAAGCLGAKSLKSAPKNTQKTLVYFLTLENPKNSIWMDEHLKTDDKSGKQNRCWNFCGKGLLWSWTARVIGKPSFFFTSCCLAYDGHLLQVDLFFAFIPIKINPDFRFVTESNTCGTCGSIQVQYREVVDQPEQSRSTRTVQIVIDFVDSCWRRSALSLFLCVCGFRILYSLKLSW